MRQNKRQKWSCNLFQIFSLSVKPTIPSFNYHLFIIIAGTKSSIRKHAVLTDSVMENESESKEESDREMHGSNWRIRLDRCMEQ